MKATSLFSPFLVIVLVVADITPSTISGLLASIEPTSNSAQDYALNLILGTSSGLQAIVNEVLNAIVGTVEGLFNPELHYSYGRSPPVYPSPQGEGLGPWAQPYEHARALVAQMTNEEKNIILYGSSTSNGCVGFTGTIPRLGFPGICFQDAENGVRTANLVNGYPAQLSVGSSWNRTLAYHRARFIGAEFKAKGANVALGPVAGPLGRIAKGGRNWEGFSNDPYLAGELVNPTVSGIQESVVACVKHFIAYEQETNRQTFFDGLLQPAIEASQSVSSNVDDRTMHELYLWPFYDAIKAGAGSVMASYNQINGSYASANSKVLNGLLKTELGFQGFALSDWYGQHTGIASADSGLDVAMPSSSRYWDDNNLAKAVSNGSMTSSRLDDMAIRLLSSWYRFAEFETPGLTPNQAVDARDPAAENIILQAAVEGHVLVKNTNNTLPLSKPKILSLFGYDAVGGKNTSAGDFLDIKYNLGLANTETYPDGTPFTDLQFALLSLEAVPAGTAGPGIALQGTLLTGGGSGATNPTSSIAPYDAFLQQANMDGTVLHTEFTSTNPKVDASSDACIVFVNEQSVEGWDRAELADAYSDNLIINVASKCPNTMVVIHNAGVRLVDRWIDHINITAVIYAHVPGQASGAALTEIMYGRQSPSGRLPYTVAKVETDYGALLNPSYPTASNPFYPQADFTEGLFIDYKAFLKNEIEPRFAFGYGLTYTTFAYSNLQISRNNSADMSTLPPDRLASPTAVAGEGGLASLYSNLYTITATITNTGNFAAPEVAQLYLGIPGSGIARALRGFEKVLLQPGASETVTFELRRRDLSTWDVQEQAWRLPSGLYEVFVGKSVLDIQLVGSFSL
ncbi:glycoside hydrolase family 3 protein [Acrodontium crateriforme]|uniref:beta-glucosidase n=1 Tax=Acrodontium crateriforme TaxID=150365 RepID=A0AAQ3RE94_9PEZI|nr:glycoside hydrolase family 3 protein [Acrodontium crateriforme]